MDILSENTLAFEKALDNVDFERIKLVMRVLDWQWVGVGFPKEDDMRRTCWELFASAVKGIQRSVRSHCSVSSGGFKVTLSLENGNFVEIEFILENSIWFDSWKGE